MHLLPLRIKEYVVGSELVKISNIRRFANVFPSVDQIKAVVVAASGN